MNFLELGAGTSDIRDLWAQAIDDYCKTTGRDIKQVQHTKNTDDLIKEQKQELNRFSKFRHDGRTTDKLRNLVSENSDLILSTAQQIGTAATPAFPPAGTILTAFTWVLKASKDVSADYDVILTFFDMQHSFLERISILESKIPTIKAYQAILMRVFSSILTLSSIATKYEQEGRFLKWAKALVKGSDEKLKGALNGLNTDVQRLESATIFATLGQTIETQKSVNEGVSLTRQVMAKQQETSVIVKEHAMLGQEHYELTKQMDIKQDMERREAQKMAGMIFRAVTQPDKDRGDQEQGKGGKTHESKDAGAGRSAALAEVKAALQTTAGPLLTTALADMQHSFVEGTFGWIAENEKYKTFACGDGEPILCVTGERGLDKSSLAFFAIDDLGRKVHQSTYRNTVAYFFFKEEHKELRSTVNLLKSVVIQVAECDNRYREEVATEVKKIREKIQDDDGSMLWEKLIAAKFSNKSESRLLLVIDGLDEADAEDRTKLVGFLSEIKRDGLQIRVLMTSGPDMEGLRCLEPVDLPMTIDNVRKGLRGIIKARIRTLARLRRLRRPVRRRITSKLHQKADSVLYVEHVLRRLNSLGREAMVLKELEKLPKSLSDLYALLVAECQKGRSDDEFASLKRLFAWLAYSKRPLTLGEASNLVKLVNEKAKLSLEEEIDGRSARLLRLAHISSEDEQSSDESDTDHAETADEGLDDPTDADPNTSAPLQFQERALRQYFREAIGDEKGLRSSASSAHLIIFKTITTILTMDAENSLLKTYAADFWIHHFLDIQMDKVSDDEVISVMESLAAIVTNKDRALKKVEKNASSLGIFGDATDLRESMFSAVNSWIGRASSFPPNTFTPETQQWIADLREDSSKLMSGMAREHVYNWFHHAAYRADACRSFQFAIRALKLTSILKEELKEVSDEPTADQILLVADAFPDMEKTSCAYRGIALVLKEFGYYEAGIEQCRESLESPESEYEHFQALGSVSEAAMYLAQREDNDEKKAGYIQETRESVSAEVDVFSRLGARCKEPDTKDDMADDFILLATCALLEDDVEAAITIFKERALPLLSKDNLVYWFLGVVTTELDQKEQYERLIQLFTEFREKDKLYWLAYNYANHEVFQRAVVKSGNGHVVVDMYKSLTKMAYQLFNTDIGFGYNLANYYYRVVGDLAKVKELLRQTMEGMAKRENTDKYVILVTRSLLAEVLTEQFRSTTDAAEKTRIVDEAKKLAFPPSYLLGLDFNSSVSNTAIPAALMVRKMGPLLEFQSILSRSFGACIEGLTDDQLWNDSLTIRFFGKLLACLPGLERDARIALASQFYFLNPAFKPQPGDGGAEAVEEQGEDATTVAAQLDVPKQQETVDGELSVEETEDGDLNAEAGVSCDGCAKDLSGPRRGPAFTCIICTDEDLCLDCHARRLSWNKGEPVTEWRTYCGKDHHYVKHPPEGWKGIKDGVICLGDEKIEFGVWLTQVQERWKVAWEEFWKKEEGVGDIL